MILFKRKTIQLITLILFFLLCIIFSPAYSKDVGYLIEVTPTVKEYAFNVVKPILDSYSKKDKLSQLLKLSEILTDSEFGVQTNTIKPSRFIIYDKLETLKLGFLYTLNLSSEQKQILKTWRSKFMRSNPADVFFAPSADDIIRTKAAFGCSHYARSFISIVKALNLVKEPQNLRYIAAAAADDYNQALLAKDQKKTINGHQFVIVKIESKWIAIDTSKSEYVTLPEGFTPDSVIPTKNISIRLPAYSRTLLIRKIGKDFNDDCNDSSLIALMNIYRSGDENNPNFKWEKYINKSS
jgi:hypothetical protein